MDISDGNLVGKTERDGHASYDASNANLSQRRIRN